MACQEENLEISVLRVSSKDLASNTLQITPKRSEEGPAQKHLIGSSTSVRGKERRALQDRRKPTVFLPLLDSDLSFPLALNSNTPSGSMCDRRADLIINTAKVIFSLGTSV